MDSFKRNIILFATFSNLYIITSVVGNLLNVPIRVCLHELEIDGFSTILIDPDANIRTYNFQRLQQQEAENSMRTPCGKVYYKRLTVDRANENIDSMLPIMFCSWLYGTVEICVDEIKQDQFVTDSMDLDNDVVLYNFRHTQLKQECINTPNGVVYYKLLAIDGVQITPRAHCTRLYEQLSHHNGRDNYHTEVAMIRGFFTCMGELKSDGIYTDIAEIIPEQERINLDLNSIDVNNIILNYNLKLLEENRVEAKTPHGIIYIKRIKDHKAYQVPSTFCPWIYNLGNVDNRYWRTTKNQLDSAICFWHLTFDQFDTDKKSGPINLARVLDLSEHYKSIDTWHGQEYRRYLINEVSIGKNPPYVKKYCNIHSKTFTFPNVN